MLVAHLTGNPAFSVGGLNFGEVARRVDGLTTTAWLCSLDPFALGLIHEAKRPLLFVYIHGWQNDAESADVCKFEHFIDTVSRYPEITGRKLNVIGVYVAWRGLD